MGEKKDKSLKLRKAASAAEVATHIGQLIHVLSHPKVQIQYQDRLLALTPSPILRVQIKARKKGETESLKIKLSWSSDDANRSENEAMYLETPAESDDASTKQTQNVRQHFSGLPTPMLKTSPEGLEQLRIGFRRAVNSGDLQHALCIGERLEQRFPQSALAEDYRRLKPVLEKRLDRQQQGVGQWKLIHFNELLTEEQKAMDRKRA